MIHRLKKRADFLRVAKGRRFSMPGLVLQMAPSGLAPPADALAANGETGPAPIRLGFTVTKKVGIAVIRNRARRRLRAAAAQIMPLHAKPGRDYVLIGREGTLTRPFPDLLADLETALTRIEGRR
jgi:ribonuclease P protein component